MKVLSIPYGPDNIHLSTACSKWDFENPATNLRELYEDMVLTMRQNEGIGLAANQVNMPYRICIIDDPIAAKLLVNPEIVESSKESNVMKEGCLSFPGLEVEVRRADRVRVKYFDMEGKEHSMDASGITARVIQHELDHLDGIHFFRRANRYHREKAFKKWKARHSI